MYPVTELWKTEVEAPVREYSWVRIVFGMTNPDIPFLSAPTDNGHLPYSQTGSVDLGANAPATYQTLERNRFVLDGKNPLPSDRNLVYQGYCGSEISTEDGTWQTQPEINIVFSSPVEFPALTFIFDESRAEYPERFQLIASLNGAEVLNTELTITNAIYEYGEPVASCDSLTLRWLKSKTPRRRARLTSLIYGKLSEVTVDNLKECTCTKEISLDSTKLPKQDFKFTFIDVERLYDPENPQGAWKYLDSRQPVLYYYGYSLSDGTIEWIPWGLSFSTGESDISKQSIVSNVTIPCTGLINHLNMSYDEGEYYPSGISLYDLAEKVMAFAGFPKTIALDESLKSVITHNPLPVLPVNQCLQLIANAGRCILSHSRGGYITISREDDNLTGFHLDFNKITNSTPETSKIPQLKTLTTEYEVMKPENAVSNAVEDFTVTGAEEQEFSFSYSTPYTNLTLTVSGGLTLVGEPRYYAYKTVAVLSGTGTVNISGKKLVSNKVKYEKQYSDVGENLAPASNVLIDNRTSLKVYSDWLAAATLRRNRYSVTDRGYPELDIGDYINFTSNFYNDIPVSVVKQEITFNGAVRGSTNMIIGGDSV